MAGRQKKHNAEVQTPDLGHAAETAPEINGEKGQDESAGQFCPVVGFGASAGGLEAMTEILREFPTDLGMAIVFIQHLDPKHASMLTDLLGRATRMPVQQVTNGLKVDPNHVYVIAPNTCIGIRHGLFSMELRNPATPHMPIDYFFRSLAEDQGSKAIGVVLSGTASDGTLGLKAIKEAGGITLAQDPESAKYDGMPRSAVVAGCVDTVLPTKGIAAELARLCRHPYLHRAPVMEEQPQNEQAFEEIMGLLRSGKGVDFSHYKPGTVRRRTMRRMAIHRLETPEQYAKYLKSNREELDLLFNDILIHVTSFFREPSTFAAISTQVLPAILRGRSQDDPLRIWVPGCATGEEAYSVAICVLEAMRQMNAEISVQLFGTDLSEVALEQARSGIYPQSIEADVSPERLRRFFVPSNGQYQIARSVRDMCIFARQNVTKDPPFSKLDVITCRNLLIYLGHRLQAKVMRMFHYALKPTGFLVLGASETIGDNADMFSPVDRQHRIYTRKPTPVAITNDFSTYEEPDTRDPVRRSIAVLPPSDSERSVDHLMLSRYAPPAVLVDPELRVLQFRGDTSPYLRHPPGNASLNLTKLARGSLGSEIRKLMRIPDLKSGPVTSKPISIGAEGEDRSVIVTVLPVAGAVDPQFLIVFEPAAPKPERRPLRHPPDGSSASAVERVRDLEEELAGTKRYLHSVIEEQEAATEELKSAHEEVQSSNEELQSTNEELLTAKEELQSTNEELTTVNDEMQSRNAELQQVNNDLINLLSSVNIPIVMLGNDLRIRRFTPHAEKILSLLPGDIGRPMSDFRLKINVPDLVKLCQTVIDSLVPREREVQDAEGRLYSMWVRPYRTADHRIDGVVLALFDVTERKQALEARYRRLFETAPDGILIVDGGTGEILDVNPALIRMTGYGRAALVGAKFWQCDLFRNSGIGEGLLATLQELESAHESPSLTSESGLSVAVDITASLYSEGDRQVVQFNIRDMSARKRLQEQLQHEEGKIREAQNIAAVGRLAGGVAHDFNNILTSITGYAELLRHPLEHDPQSLHMLDEIRREADRAVGVTRQLLAFGRKQTAHPGIMDLNVVIAEMRQMIGALMTDEVELDLRLSPEPAVVSADRTQMEQVILALTANARDAMPDGGRVTISTSREQVDQSSRQPGTVPPGSYVALTVRDTGSGMDKESEAQLFDPFRNGKTGAPPPALGLAAVSQMVRQSGGYVRAFSELGVGTTFAIYLPAESATPETGAPEDGHARGNEIVLLVEDERPVRMLARRFLEMRGYQVLEAASGPEALRVARAHTGPIHLLMTDVVMPRMSGREVALQLAAERPEMKVLYVSGHTEDVIGDYGIGRDGLEFLRKPFTQSELAVRVRKILDQTPGA